MYIQSCTVETVQPVARKKTENCHQMLVMGLWGRTHSTIPHKGIVFNTSYLHLFLTN